MATITINITDADLPRVITAICGVLNYQPTLTDMLGRTTPNPETPAQFARRMVVTDVKSYVVTWEGQQAAATAQATAVTTANGVGVS